MKESIDLSKYNLRTDIAIEQIDNISDMDVKIKRSEKNNVEVESIELTKDNKHLFNKKEGVYITLKFEDATDRENISDIEDVLIEQLNELIKGYNLNIEDNVLIVGLGNKDSTPDSLGPKVIDEIIVTSHLYEIGQVHENYQNTSAISFGVTGTTGIETSKAIKAIVDSVKPKLVIVIDALASSVIENLNKTIQITTAGIHPGSGIGNSRQEISKDILGVDVIAIGVPTVVDCLTIISSSFDYIYKFLAYNLGNPVKNKLATYNSINYLKENYKTLDYEDRKSFLGAMGTLDENELKSFIEQVITPIGLNMMVTPKEVDFTISKLSNLIASGINRTLHFEKM